MNRLRTLLTKHNAEILLLIGLLAWLVGAVGYAQIYPGSWSNAFYASLKHFTLDVAVAPGVKVNIYIEVSRWLAAITLAGTIMNIVSMLAKNSYEKVRLKHFCDGHTIVCGVGLKGERLVEDLLKHGHQVVVIDVNPDNPALPILSQKGAIVVIGNASDADVLKNAELDKAKIIIAVTGSDQTSIAIAQSAISIKKNSSTEHVLQCIAHITDDSLRRLLYQHHSVASNQPNFDLRLFSFYENGAHEIIQDYFSRNLGSFTSASQSDTPLHLMLVGFGRIGQSVAIEAARMGAYPDGKKLVVSVLSKNADTHEKKIRNGFPKLFELMNLRFLAHDVEFLPANFNDLIPAESPVDLIVISLGDELKNFKAAHELSKKFINAAKPPQIVMCGNGEVGQLTEENSKIRSYSMLDKVCTYEAVVNPIRESMAKAIHGNYLIHNTGAPSSKPWNELSLEFKDSNRDQAEHIRVKLNLVGCKLTEIGNGIVTALTGEEIQSLARVEHARWMSEKILAGWSYGETRNNDKKIHPSLVPYDNLSEAEKQKDIDAVREIPNLVQLNGQQIVRVFN